MLLYRDLLTLTVEELIAVTPAARHILGEHGVDLCRHYHRSVRAAAQASGVDGEAVARALRGERSEGQPGVAIGVGRAAEPRGSLPRDGRGGWSGLQPAPA